MFCILRTSMLWCYNCIVSPPPPPETRKYIVQVARAFKSSLEWFVFQPYRLFACGHYIKQTLNICDLKLSQRWLRRDVLCRLVAVYRRFGGIWYFYFQSRRVGRAVCVAYSSSPEMEIYRHFGVMFNLRVQGRRVRETTFLAYFAALKMEVVHSSDAPVTIYKTTRRKIPYTVLPSQIL
jgi:hypothetical protein